MLLLLVLLLLLFGETRSWRGRAILKQERERFSSENVRGKKKQSERGKTTKGFFPAFAPSLAPPTPLIFTFANAGSAENGRCC